VDYNSYRLPEVYSTCSQENITNDQVTASLGQLNALVSTLTTSQVDTNNAVQQMAVNMNGYMMQSTEKMRIVEAKADHAQATGNQALEISQNNQDSIDELHLQQQIHGSEGERIKERVCALEECQECDDEDDSSFVTAPMDICPSLEE